jgi:hypothetical protein
MLWLMRHPSIPCVVVDGFWQLGGTHTQPCALKPAGLEFLKDRKSIYDDDMMTNNDQNDHEYDPK